MDQVRKGTAGPAGAISPATFLAALLPTRTSTPRLEGCLRFGGPWLSHTVQRFGGAETRVRDTPRRRATEGTFSGTGSSETRRRFDSPLPCSGARVAPGPSPRDDLDFSQHPASLGYIGTVERGSRDSDVGAILPSSGGAFRGDLSNSWAICCGAPLHSAEHQRDGPTKGRQRSVNLSTLRRHRA